MRSSNTPEDGFSQVPEEFSELDDSEAMRLLAEHVEHLIDTQYPELRDFPGRVKDSIKERLRHPDFDDPEVAKLFRSRLVPHDPEVQALVIAGRQRYQELLSKEVAVVQANQAEQPELTPEQVRQWCAQADKEAAQRKAALKAVDERPKSEADRLEIERMIRVLEKDIDRDIEKAGKPKPSARQTNPGEIGEIGVFPAINWGASSSNSPNTPEQLSQKAEFPADSILADYYDYAITQSEGADSYITGAILPMIGAILARNVWTPWAAYNGRLYPNIYSILVGPPGNLKSTSIYPAESIARALLEKTRFLSHNYSPEAIFDSFFKHADRLLVCSDAGSTITRWANPYDGQRLSHSFLTLFDCEPMSEGFRRNRQEDNLDTQERVTGPLSLSILFGSTLSKCQFDGNNERDGLQRRFLYHLALTKARDIDRPQPDKVWLKGLIDQFERLTYLKGAFVWDSAARIRFDLYKKEIEQRKKTHDLYDEATQGRLSTLCVYALKIAMIFEATRLCFDTSWMPRDPEIVPHSPSLQIGPDTLELAIAYVEECFNAAQSLADVANHKVIREKAETLLANIRGHFAAYAGDSQSIIVTRSQLTRAFADHPRRHSDLSVDYLYGQIIPFLIKAGEAKLLRKEGKKETYAFRVE